MSNSWYGRRVFLTGHTGFKGCWLTHWLAMLGAEVHGYALPPTTAPSLFTLSTPKLASNTLADIAESEHLTKAIKRACPDLVIHMAAQPLVHASYQQPVNTWRTNVLGTVNLLEAVRRNPSVAAVLIVTTDKCYENREWLWGYRENESLGGHDPYSASKAATELVAQSYRASFFDNNGPLLATARAGNVIGGGDWSDKRLLPDAVRAITTKSTLLVRHPSATRPWQHVLDCLSGYLCLAENLLAGNRATACAFNFGPAPEGNLTVGEVLSRFQAAWPSLKWSTDYATEMPHETNFLYLDSSLARQTLNWCPHWNIDTAIARTAAWYRDESEGQAANHLIYAQLEEYLTS